jgi:hypothetical protein
VSRLRTGEWLAATGGLLALLSLFVMHWYEGIFANLLLSQSSLHHRFLPSGIFSAVNGWDAVPTLRWFVLVTAALGLLLAVAQAATPGPALPVTIDLAAMIVAGVTTILVAIRLASTSAPLRFGAIVGLFSVGLVAIGAYQAMHAEQGWTPGVDREVELVELSGERVGD